MTAANLTNVIRAHWLSWHSQYSFHLDSPEESPEMVTITIFHCNPTLEPQSFSTPCTQFSISLLYIGSILLYIGNILLSAKKRYLIQRGKVVLTWIKPIKQSALTQNLLWRSQHELGIYLFWSSDKREKWSRSHLQNLSMWAQALTYKGNIQRL